MSTLHPNIDSADVQQQVERVLRSHVFRRAYRSQRFLRYLTEAALDTPVRTVKEYAIALDVFDRDSSYDPAIDATVRVEASRLRGRLREYYAEEGQDDLIVLLIPKGAYSVSFVCRNPGQTPAPTSTSVSPIGQPEPPASQFIRDDTARPAFSSEEDSPESLAALAGSFHSLGLRFARPLLVSAVMALVLIALMALVLALRFRRTVIPAAQVRFPDPLRQTHSVSPAVREACIRGRNYFDKRDAVASEQAYRQAIDLDPDYAPAYAGLANALGSEVLLDKAPMELNVPRAMQAAQHALELDLRMETL